MLPFKNTKNYPLTSSQTYFDANMEDVTINFDTSYYHAFDGNVLEMDEHKENQTLQVPYKRYKYETNFVENDFKVKDELPFYQYNIPQTIEYYNGNVYNESFNDIKCSTVMPREVKKDKPLTTVRRRVSAIRVKKDSMTLSQLEKALRRKLFEKLGRNVDVSLIDKTHCRCGICKIIISLNKKFEVVHVVRHFNAWHPAVHMCTRSWPGLEGSVQNSNNEFDNYCYNQKNDKLFFGRSHIKFINKRTDVDIGGTTKQLKKTAERVSFDDRESNYLIQCLRCFKIMEHHQLSMHFSSDHSGYITTPRCNLCIKEILINAELYHIHETNFEVSIKNEKEILSNHSKKIFENLDELFSHIQNFVKNGRNNEEEQNNSDTIENKDELPIVPQIEHLNSRRTLGRGSKPKRNFVHPQYRQACPVNSEYVEQIEQNRWRCKLCDFTIVGAVISAAAIRHFKRSHLGNNIINRGNIEFLDKTSVYYKFNVELCNARLEKCSSGEMKMTDENTVVCYKCNDVAMNLHKPFNICRGIRHLKSRHPELMPEHNISLMESFKTEVIKDTGTDNNLSSRQEVDNMDVDGGFNQVLISTVPGHPYNYQNIFYDENNVEQHITFSYPEYDVPQGLPIQEQLQYNMNNYYQLPYFDPSGEVTHTEGYFLTSQSHNEYINITLKDGREEFYQKIPLTKYRIPKNITNIVKLEDIDGNECFVIMKENEEFDSDAALKVFYKNY
uniref:C2H2-type domain-containing protein n=1 Tax=Parastrongyloides trichosuri TaxID=131310 RepID=A0A0N4ZPV5_PARTI